MCPRIKYDSLPLYGAICANVHLAHCLHFVYDQGHARRRSMTFVFTDCSLQRPYSETTHYDRENIYRLRVYTALLCYVYVHELPQRVHKINVFFMRHTEPIACVYISRVPLSLYPYFCSRLCASANERRGGEQRVTSPAVSRPHWET